MTNKLQPTSKTSNTVPLDLVKAHWKRFKKQINSILSIVQPEGWIAGDDGLPVFSFSTDFNTDQLYKLLNRIVTDNPVRNILTKTIQSLLDGNTLTLLDLNRSLNRHGYMLVVVWDNEARGKFAEGKKPPLTHMSLVTLDEYYDTYNVIDPRK